MKSPDNISGIRLWFDASDSSTINDGIVTNNQNVYKFVDKIGGISLTNPNGPLGPTYAFGAINGRNAISFTYYNSTVATNPHLKRLAAVNVSALSTGTYSMYVAFFPNDIRQEPSPTTAGTNFQTRCGVVSIISGSRIGAAPAGGFIDRSLYHTSYANSNTDRNTTIGYYDSLPTYTTFNTFVFDNMAFRQPNARSLTSGIDYQYGKTNVVGVRIGPGIQKSSFLRSGSSISGNFLPISATGNRVRPSNAVIINPSLVIGATWVGYTVNGVPYHTLTTRAADNFSPMEGFFCEMIFFDRILTDAEDNTVLNYLVDKWIN